MVKAKTDRENIIIKKTITKKKRKNIVKVTISQLSRTIHVEGSVNGICGKFTIDCASEVSLISEQFWSNMDIKMLIRK